MTYMYTCTVLIGTCVETYRYFRQFVVSFKKYQNYVVFYQEPETDKKFPEPEPEPLQNRPALTPCLGGPEP